jgi:hypothetical protein
MKKLAETKEKFKKAIQKDPFLVGLIWNIKMEGIANLTDHGTIIIMMENPKTGTTVILDPAKPYLFIEDNGEGYNIPIQTAIRITLETFGAPKVTEIPKFGFYFPEAEDNPLFRNAPSNHQEAHPTERHEH